MAGYLLFDPTSAPVARLATAIARETDGRLTVRSLHDPLIQDELDRGHPAWRWEPTLLETDTVRVSTGLALRSRLVAILGPRRAWRVAQLVAEAQVPTISVNQTRRGFVKCGTALAAGVTGAFLLGPGPRIGQAQSDKVDSTSIAAQGKTKPGKYSRREGIVSWKVRRRGSEYTVRFTHKRRNLSGHARVNPNRDGKTGTWALTRGSYKLQVAFNGRTFSGTDSRGARFTGTWNRNRQRWDMNAQSKRDFREVRQDFSIGCAMLADLTPLRRSAGQQVSSAASPDCSRCNNEQAGTAVAVPKSAACYYATQQLNQDCFFVSGGAECCRIHEDECDCACAPGTDYFCHCTRTGLACACADCG